MKNQVLCLMLGAALLSLVNGCQKPVQADTFLQLSQTEVSLPAEGGTRSVAFKVTNPKDGAEVTVSAPEVEWVSNFVIGESDIAFDVDKNVSDSPRSVKVAVSYPGVEPDAEFTISQAAGVPVPFTITVKNITETTADFDIVPLDPEMSYIFFSTTQDYIDYNNLNTDEALYQDDMEYIKNQIMSGYTFDYFLSKGEQKDIPISGMYPNSENVVYAYGVDPVSQDRLTDIVYARFTTLDVERIDVNFTFGEPVIDGPSVSVDVFMNGYDGYWSAFALPASSFSPDESVYDYCSQFWLENVSIYQMLGYSNEEILQDMCMVGDTNIRFNLDPSTEYVIAVFPVNEDALVSSDPATLNIETGAVEPSDNVISIEVSDIKGSSAVISFLPSNDDPYAFDVYPSSDFDGLSDSDIIDMCMSNSPNETRGSFSSKITGILPQTSYTAIAFGYQAGVATTGLFKYTFTTADPVTGPVEFELKFDDYYDAAASSEALRSAGYPGDADYIDQVVDAGLDVLLPVQAVTTPDVGTFYYVLFSDSEENHTDNPDEYISYLSYYGNSNESAFFTVNYDMPLFAVGVAFDDNGEPGPVWVSDSFTLTRDGVSDPQGFVDYLYPSASVTMTRASSAPCYKMNIGGDSRVERFSPAAAPSGVSVTSAVVAGEAKCCLPENISCPVADSFKAAGSMVMRNFIKR